MAHVATEVAKGRIVVDDPRQMMLLLKPHEVAGVALIEHLALASSRLDLGGEAVGVENVQARRILAPLRTTHVWARCSIPSGFLHALLLPSERALQRLARAPRTCAPLRAGEPAAGEGC